MLNLLLMMVCVGMLSVHIGSHRDRHFPPPKLPRPANVPAPPRIGVLIVADPNAQAQYARTIRTMSSYTLLNGYDLVVWDPWAPNSINDEDCRVFTHLFFKRHCIAHELLDYYDILAAIDADVAAVGFGKRIEALFRPGVQVVHEERFHNGEVHAGAYAVRKGTFAKEYLMQWASFETRLPKGFNNGDNGALHLHLLTTLWGPTNSSVQRCGGIWDAAKDLQGYDSYVGCIMQGLQKTTSAEIRLVRRGHGFCRDLWVTGGQTSPVDMFVHGIKQDDSMSMQRLTIDAMRPVMARADAVARQERPDSWLEAARIDHCWPKCPEYW